MTNSEHELEFTFAKNREIGHAIREAVADAQIRESLALNGILGISLWVIYHTLLLNRGSGTTYPLPRPAIIYPFKSPIM